MWKCCKPITHSIWYVLSLSRWWKLLFFFYLNLKISSYFHRTVPCRTFFIMWHFGQLQPYQTQRKGHVISKRLSGSTLKKWFSVNKIGARLTAKNSLYITNSIVLRWKGTQSLVWSAIFSIKLNICKDSLAILSKS